MSPGSSAHAAIAETIAMRDSPFLIECISCDLLDESGLLSTCNVSTSHINEFVPLRELRPETYRDLHMHSNDRFGSLAASFANISLMSASEGKADVNSP